MGIPTFSKRFAIGIASTMAVYGGLFGLIAIDHNSLESKAANRNHTWEMIAGTHPIDDSPGGKVAEVVQPYMKPGQPIGLEDLYFSVDRFAGIDEYVGQRFTQKGVDRTDYMFSAEFLSSFRQITAGKPETVLVPPRSPIESEAPVWPYINALTLVGFAAQFASYRKSQKGYSDTRSYNKPLKEDYFFLAVLAPIPFLALCVSSIAALAWLVGAPLGMLLAARIARWRIQKSKPPVLKTLEGLQIALVQQEYSYEQESQLRRIERLIGMVHALPKLEAQELSTTIALEIKPLLDEIERMLQDQALVIRHKHAEIRKADQPELAITNPGGKH